MIIIKYKLGQWVSLYSPLNGDKNKKTGLGQEVRFGLILDYNDKTKKYLIQMLTSKDKHNSNWTFITGKGQKISGRSYYRVNVYEGTIIRLKRSFEIDAIWSRDELDELRKISHPYKYGGNPSIRFVDYREVLKSNKVIIEDKLINSNCSKGENDMLLERLNKTLNDVDVSYKKSHQKFENEMDKLNKKMISYEETATEENLSKDKNKGFER